MRARQQRDGTLAVVCQVLEALEVAGPLGKQKFNKKIKIIMKI